MEPSKLIFLRSGGVEKGGRYYPTEREKDQAKGITDIQAGIQAGGSASGPQQWKEPDTGSQRLGVAVSTLAHWCKRSQQYSEQAFPGSGQQTPQLPRFRPKQPGTDPKRRARLAKGGDHQTGEEVCQIPQSVRRRSPHASAEHGGIPAEMVRQWTCQPVCDLPPIWWICRTFRA